LGYAILAKQTVNLTSFFSSYLDLVFQIVGLIFYIAFTRKFLNTKEHYPFLNRLFRTEELLLLFMLIIYSIIHFFTNWIRLEDLIEYLMKFVTIALGIVYIFVALKQQNKLLNYLAIGNAVLLLFGCISMWLLISHRGTRLTSIFESSLVYYEVGIVLELIFFLYGLAYKNRTELIERTRMEEAIKLESEKQTFEKQIAILHAQQEERNRISRDMHDDLGSGMTAIRLYSELAKKKIAGTIPEIEKISSSADELINKMNTIIWTMSSSNDTLGNLVAYIRSYAINYLEDMNIDCEIHIENKHQNVTVPGSARRNVFMIVKETLNNILKHSKASKVVINYSETPGLFKLTIRDNGVGIDMDNLREFGNGLKNMKQRAEHIGCSYSIENDHGTCTTLQFQFNPEDYR
jgi:signal transduction histidine kinase